MKNKRRQKANDLPTEIFIVAVSYFEVTGGAGASFIILKQVI